MPLLVTTPVTTPVITPDPVVTITNPESTTELPYRSKYKDNTVRDKDTDLNALLQHVDGSPWTVDFYLNVNGSSQANTGFNPTPDEGNIFQQYHRIRDMELRVTSPLSFEHDTETGNTYYEGSANFYARVIPNEGNVFVAGIGNGRRVVFEITQAVPTSALSNTIYLIQYRSKFEITPTITAALDDSTVKTSVFVRESLFGISRGLFSSEEHDIYLSSKTALRRLHEVYGSLHYDSRYDTLMLEAERLYDPHVVEFMNALPKDNLNAAQRYRELIISHEGLDYGSIYSELMGHFYHNSKMMRRSKLTSVHEAYCPMVFGGIAATEIKSYVDIDKSVYVPVGPVTPPETLPLYHTLPSDYYVLTGNYVEHEVPMSVLEREVWNFQHDKVVDLAAVVELANEKNIRTLTVSESFYYLPLIAYLLCVVIREY